MNAMTAEFHPGSLVSARGREWIVLPESNAETLHLRPLGGGEKDESLIYLPLERQPVQPATFPWPTVEQARNHAASQLLMDALQLKLRNGAGPFRSFGNIAVEPRAYQLVPLLMAMKLATVRLLIADDVGIGKTIEGALIAREMLDRGEIGRMTVLCPPHLCEPVSYTHLIGAWEPHQRRTYCHRRFESVPRQSGCHQNKVRQTESPGLCSTAGSTYPLSSH